MINAIVYPASFLILIITLFMLRKNMHKIMRPGMRKNLLLSYLGLLVVLTIVFFIIQPQVKTPDKKLEQAPMILEIVHEADDFSILEPYKVNEWDIEVEEEDIRLQVMYTGHWVDTYIPVIVVEDATRQNEAHVVHYETASTLNGVDISSYIELPEIDVKKEHIVVKLPGDIYDEQEFRSIQNEGVLKQFKSKDSETSYFDMDVGELVIVLTVPEGTTVTANVDQFDIIRK